jgi:hypothetical protein
LRRLLSLFCVLSLFVTAAAAAADSKPSTSDTAKSQLLETVLANAGAAKAPKIDGVLRFDVTAEETTSDGVPHDSKFTAWVNPANFAQRRLQLNQKVVIGFDGQAAWATIGGKPDTRPQTGLQGAGTLNRLLFPLLLPLSLDQAGVHLGSPSKATWERNPALKASLIFPPNFFYSPVMDTNWELFVDPATHRILGAQFTASYEYAKVGAEGMRYYVLTWTTVDGLTLPAKLLAVGIDPQGHESGHVKRINVTWKKVSGDASLFLSPQALSAIGEQQQ